MSCPTRPDDEPFATELEAIFDDYRRFIANLAGASADEIKAFAAQHAAARAALAHAEHLQKMVRGRRAEIATPTTPTLADARRHLAAEAEAPEEREHDDDSAGH